jgi:hypothetical protein
VGVFIVVLVLAGRRRGRERRRRDARDFEDAQF